MPIWNKTLQYLPLAHLVETSKYGRNTGNSNAQIGKYGHAILHKLSHGSIKIEVHLLKY